MLLLLLHILIHDIFIELLEASELEAALIPSAFLTSKNGGSVETMTLTFLPLYSAPVWREHLQGLWMIYRKLLILDASETPFLQKDSLYPLLVLFLQPVLAKKDCDWDFKMRLILDT